MEVSERPKGCISFPDSVSDIQNKVSDMVRLHFPCCPSMPDDVRQQFKSLRGYDSKKDSDESASYWVESARDLGLSNTPPSNNTVSQSGPGMWGITFRRDPLQPSPADELDFEFANEKPPADDKNILVRAADKDRGLCTDQIFLLMRQLRPCRFKKSDRRPSSSSRGRDRSMGFPGLACMHTGRRFFPVSAKVLTNNAINSILQHVIGSSKTPEPIKASLLYLGNRSKLQKAALPSNWKKTFFKKIWERLHTERKWTSIDEKGGESSEYSSDDEDDEDDQGYGTPKDAGSESDDGGKEELGDHMNALVQAAALWLTDQDSTADETKSAAKTLLKKGRTLPGKRASPFSPKAKVGRGTNSLPTSKRRRVHYS